jgi:hypothetical protein
MLWLRGLIAWIGLGLTCGSFGHADSLNASVLSSVTIDISGKSSAFVFRHFKRVAKSDGMYCGYKNREDLFIDPAPRMSESLICGPKKGADLLIMSKNGKSNNISIDVDWLEESCKATNPYTNKQLQAMAARVINDLRTALTGNRLVTDFVVTRQDFTNAECPKGLPFN